MRYLQNTVLILLVFFVQVMVYSQAINNSGIERNMNRDRYFRINYENDFFTKADYYYTQGVFIELVSPALSKNPINKLFFKKANSSVKYGIAIEDNAYTPTNYVKTQILVGDRPFAANLSLKTYTIASDSINNIRINSSLLLGILGPGAGGKEVQTTIHRLTPNAIPKGWRNQIKNDLVLNYEVGIEKQLFQLNNFFHLSANCMARLGTLSNKANIGTTAMIGIFSLPDKGVSSKRFELYFYDKPLFNAIAYDATLQGGFFNKQSEYSLSANQINNFVIRNNWGVVLKFGGMYFEYYQSQMTKEFKTGKGHRNGGIQIGFCF